MQRGLQVWQQICHGRDRFSKLWILGMLAFHEPLGKENLDMQGRKLYG